MAVQVVVRIIVTVKMQLDVRLSNTIILHVQTREYVVGWRCVYKLLYVSG